MKALVTGGAGFIGQHLCRRLIAEANDVVVFDALTRAATGKQLLLDAGIPIVTGGVEMPESVFSTLAFHKPDIVFHLAAESHVDASLVDPKSAILTNAVGTQVVASACTKFDIPLVYCSTDEVYGDLYGTRWAAGGAKEGETPLRPSSPYSAGKAGGEFVVHAMARSFGLRAMITRGSNAYGPGQLSEKLVPIVSACATDDRPVPVHGDGEQIRQWIHVAEFAEALSLAGKRALTLPHGQTETWNIAGPERMSVNEVVRLFGAVAEHGPDRPGQDRLYAISGEKMAAVGFMPIQRLAYHADFLKRHYMNYEIEATAWAE